MANQLNSHALNPRPKEELIAAVNVACVGAEFGPFGLFKFLPTALIGLETGQRPKE